MGSTASCTVVDRGEGSSRAPPLGGAGTGASRALRVKARHGVCLPAWCVSVTGSSAAWEIRVPRVRPGVGPLLQRAAFGPGPPSGKLSSLLPLPLCTAGRGRGGVRGGQAGRRKPRDAHAVLARRAAAAHEQCAHGAGQGAEALGVTAVLLSDGHTPPRRRCEPTALTLPTAPLRAATDNTAAASDHTLRCHVGELEPPRQNTAPRPSSSSSPCRCRWRWSSIGLVRRRPPAADRPPARCCLPHRAPAPSKTQTARQGA